MSNATVQTAQIVAPFNPNDYVSPFSNSPADYEQDCVNMDSLAEDIAVDAYNDGFDGAEPLRPLDSFYMDNYNRGVDAAQSGFSEF